MSSGQINKYRTMKNSPNIALVIAALTILVWPNAFGQMAPINSFETPLVLIEVVSVQPFDASNDDRFAVKSKERVHGALGKIVDVFDGPKDLVGATFPLASPIYTKDQREPESLTPNVLEFEGVADKELLPVGARMVLPVMRIKDYDYTKYSITTLAFPTAPCSLPYLEQASSWTR